MIGHSNEDIHRIVSPLDAGSASVMINVDVDDIDAHYAHAVAEGADITMELEDAWYGSRRYEATDLEGHRWHFDEPHDRIRARGGDVPDDSAGRLRARQLVAGDGRGGAVSPARSDREVARHVVGDELARRGQDETGGEQRRDQQQHRRADADRVGEHADQRQEDGDAGDPHHGDRAERHGADVRRRDDRDHGEERRRQRADASRQEHVAHDGDREVRRVRERRQHEAVEDAGDGDEAQQEPGLLERLARHPRDGDEHADDLQRFDAGGDEAALRRRSSRNTSS